MPLTLTGKRNHVFQIGDYRVQVVAVGQNVVKLVFDAPREIPVRRLGRQPFIGRPDRSRGTGPDRAA